MHVGLMYKSSYIQTMLKKSIFTLVSVDESCVEHMLDIDNKWYQIDNIKLIVESEDGGVLCPTTRF